MDDAAKLVKLLSLSWSVSSLIRIIQPLTQRSLVNIWSSLHRMPAITFGWLERRVGGGSQWVAGRRSHGWVFV